MDTKRFNEISSANSTNTSAELLVLTNPANNTTRRIAINNLPLVSSDGGTINGNLIIDKITPTLVLKDTSQTAGTPPESGNKNTEVLFYDSNNAILGFLNCQYQASGRRRMVLNCRNSDATANTSFEVGFDTNGNAYSSFPDTTCVDGQWVSSSILISSANLTVGSYTYDMSSYLPNDNFNYEVLFNVYSASSGNAYLAFTTDIITHNTTQSYASIKAPQSSLFILPIGKSGTQRNFNYAIIGADFTTLQIRAFGYRRIGTNS